MKEDNLQQLLSLSLDLLNQSTVDGVLRLIEVSARSAVDAGVSSIWYRFPDHAGTYILCTTGSSTSSVNPAPIPASFLDNWFATDNTIHLDGTAFLRDPHFEELPKVHVPLRGLLGARIQGVQGTTQGAIFVSDKKGGRDFTRQDKKLLLHIASVASLALKHVAAREEAEARSTQQEETEKRLETAMLAANEGVWEMDLISGKAWVSESFIRMFSPLPTEEVSQAWWEERVHPDDLPEVLDGVAMAVNDSLISSWTTYYRFRLGNGQYADIIDRAIFSRDDAGRATKVIGAMHDVTALRRAEKTAKESEQLYRAVVNNISDAILIIDRKVSIMVANRAYMDLHGLRELPTMREFKNRYKAFHPDGRPMEGREWPIIKALSGSPVTNVEIRVHDSLHGTFWIGRYNFIPITDEKGRIQQVVVTIHDVTDIRGAFAKVEQEVERRTNELAATVEALRASEETYALSIKAMGASIWEWKSGEHRRPSPECCALHGYAEDELGAIEWPLSYVHPDDIEPTDTYFKRYVNGEIESPYEQTFRVQHKDGTYRWILSRAAAVWGTEGKVVRLVGTHSDITEKITVERQLQHAQKMDSIGLLAGGIAHDFNNLLTVILGYSEQLAEMTQPGPEQATSKEILAAAIRAQALTKKLLTFSRQQVMTLKPVNIGDAVASTISFLSRVIGEDIEVILENSGVNLIILGDADQFEQVLSNIILNARDAMEGGGKLFVSTKEIVVDAAFASKSGLEGPGTYAAVTIRDTGKGIPESNRNRIFEPFFTTKDVGKGTGLGLSIAFGIVKQHKGVIVVESELNRGTTFTIYLPSSERRVGGRRNRAAECAGVADKRILVVEDEAIVRNLMKTLLGNAGYMVETAEDGMEALYVLEKQPVDLVISDVLMPRMNGKELYNETRARFPETGFIFMSGYPSDLLTTKGLSEEHVVFIEKPIKRDHLLQKVQECLEEESRPRRSMTLKYST